MPIPLVIEPTLPIIISAPIRLVLFIVSTGINFCEINLAKKIRIINRDIGSFFI